MFAYGLSNIMLGPAAGLFVAVGAHVIAVIDAATFAFPVISLLLLRVREPVPSPAVGRWSATPSRATGCTGPPPLSAYSQPSRARARWRAG